MSKKYKQFLEELPSLVEQGYLSLQDEAYNLIDAKTHKNFIDLTKNGSDANFYNLLQYYKDAGKNVLRVIGLEKKLINSLDSEKNQQLHEDAKEQTNYFLLNLNMGIEQTHRFVKNQLGLSAGWSRKDIQEKLIKNPSTNKLGNRLRSFFHEDYSSNVINTFRNSLVHDRRAYDIIRRSVYPSKKSNFEIKIIGDLDWIRGPNIIYDEPLESLPISNTKVPMNLYSMVSHMVVENVPLIESFEIEKLSKENVVSEEVQDKKENELFEQEWRSVENMYNSLNELTAIKTKNSVIPSLNLCDFLASTYRIFPFLSGLTVAEAINISQKHY
jgi:hypothetical protein